MDFFYLVCRSTYRRNPKLKLETIDLYTYVLSALHALLLDFHLASALLLCAQPWAKCPELHPADVSSLPRSSSRSALLFLSLFFIYFRLFVVGESEVWRRVTTEISNRRKRSNGEKRSNEHFFLSFTNKNSNEQLQR